MPHNPVSGKNSGISAADTETARERRPAPTRKSAMPLGSTPPAMVPFLLHFLEPVLESCALRPVGRVGHLFAKLVFSVPEVLTVLRVVGRRRLPVPWRRRRRRRLTNRDLAKSWHPDLSLRKGYR